MSNFWGSSWGSAWGSAWGVDATPPPPPIPPPPAPPLPYQVEVEGISVDSINIYDLQVPGPHRDVDEEGVTTQDIHWEGDERLKEGDDMIQYRYPLRRLNRHNFTYVFRNPKGQVINLTDYYQVHVIVKRNGSALTTLYDGYFVGAKTTGKVGVNNVEFATAGRWDLQFKLLTLNAKPLYSEPIQFDVVINVDDLALDENASE